MFEEGKSYIEKYGSVIVFYFISDQKGTSVIKFNCPEIKLKQ